MSETSRRVFDLTEFLSWETAQERTFERLPHIRCHLELVDGEAVMMAGGTQAHALIAMNITSVLRTLLRGSPCRPSGSDLRVPIVATGNCRYPDVTVDCGTFDPAAHDASEPTIAFEVLSDSTGWYDQTRKLRDYDSVPSIRQYVCVSQSERRVLVWLRDASGGLVPEAVVFDGVLRLHLGAATVDSTVRARIGAYLAEIYEGTGLPDHDAAASAR